MEDKKVREDQPLLEGYGTSLEERTVGEAFPPARVSYDDVLKEIGEFGRWQQWQTLLYCVPPFVSGALFMLGTFTSELLS